MPREPLTEFITGQSGVEPLSVMETRPPGITASECLECQMFDGWACQYAAEGNRERLAWVGRERNRHRDPLFGECTDPTRTNTFKDPEDEGLS
ncbi:hypothetical protein ACFVXH_03225 [Kitasatospora sp. NPDC058184]|uniref:hypothetical protein n=1 Tax=Kitasatospora sp. NPDC058184 TaxID=3346370 RepID=UPI0036DA306E